MEKYDGLSCGMVIERAGVALAAAGGLIAEAVKGNENNHMGAIIALGAILGGVLVEGAYRINKKSERNGN